MSGTGSDSAKYQPFPKMDSPIANPDLTIGIPWYYLLINMWTKLGGSAIAATTTLGTVQTAAQAAQASATAAGASAAQALTNASTAQSTASAAGASATTAQEAAEAAQTSATTANTTANKLAAQVKINPTNVQVVNALDTETLMELLDAAPAAGGTSLLLLVNSTAGVVLAAVTLGAPNSGGTGFRQLLVAN